MRLRSFVRYALRYALGPLVALGWARSAAAREPRCAAAPAISSFESTDALLTAAGSLESEIDRPRARALYLAVLARDPHDDDATNGLARLDARDRCFALAERGYREVLARSPANLEARAGLADLLVWTSRLAAAHDVLAQGLVFEPLAPELLARMARVFVLEGDATRAKPYLDEAERVSPLDLEIREARDRFFLGQARLAQRVELFPSGYDDVLTTTMSGMQRYHRLQLELGAIVVERSGATRDTRSGPQKTTIIDGRPAAGLYVHHDGGGYIGGSIGLGAPARSLPRYALSLSAFEPLGRLFALGLTTAFWHYVDERNVLIFAPSLTFALTESIDLTARYWFTSVVAQGPLVTGAASARVHSAGLRAVWRPTPRTTLGADYTYGVQLDRNPSATDLLQLRSHVVSAFVRHSLTRTLGFDFALSLERRLGTGSAPSVFGVIGEGGVFVRW